MSKFSWPLPGEGVTAEELLMAEIRAALAGVNTYSGQARRDAMLTEIVALLYNGAATPLTAPIVVGTDPGAPTGVVPSVRAQTAVRAGVAEMGDWPSQAGAAFFGRADLDQSQGGNYAVLQDNQGNTLVNAVATKEVRLRIANADMAKVDTSAVAGDTRLLLYDVTAGTLVRVTRGAVDSGGAGFRVLRVPN